MMDYYARRAAEYEAIYQKPERQDDLRTLAGMMSTMFKGRDVLEIACGTGYWTQIMAESATSILATDCSRQVLEIAKHKDYKRCSLSFLESDAYSLSNVSGNFTGGYCGFWWSHIPKAKIAVFLQTLHSKLMEDALVVMMDNKYVEGSSTPLSRTDKDGNTYQRRRLADGSEHEVLKNFPNEDQIKTSLRDCSNNLQVVGLDYYWLVKYTVRKV
jgi:SAM-dependent methyltransferase